MSIKKQTPYDVETMKKYCKDNIDKYQIEPIVRECFHEGLINPAIAYIYLRIAQKESGEKITYCQIAKEVGLSSGAVKKYKKDALKGITQKKFIQLIIKTQKDELLNIYEKNNFMQELTDHINLYKDIVVRNGVKGNKQCGLYELLRETSISKEVCRKTYDELINTKLKERDTYNSTNTVLLTVEIKNDKEIIIKYGDEENDNKYIKYDKENIVHDIVKKLQRIVGAYLSARNHWEGVYLIRNGNRKRDCALEYIALQNENVFLI